MPTRKPLTAIRIVLFTEGGVLKQQRFLDACLVTRLGLCPLGLTLTVFANASLQAPINHSRAWRDLALRCRREDGDPAFRPFMREHLGHGFPPSWE